jgi:pyridoxal phosphate enzyme (YggS family)
MNSIEKNLNDIHHRINSAAMACGRPTESVQLLAVSKRKPAQDIRQAYTAGQREFGENYLQESLQKMETLEDLSICWHFIGAIQSNKTRSIAEAFDWVHCVDRLKIATRLSEQRPAGRKPLNVCIQINLDDEDSKAGIDLTELSELAVAMSVLPGICLRGLMTIPAPRADYAQQCQAFARMTDALAALRQQGLDCDTLSMGMTGDMEAAIAQGSTMVRIGTAIFGERL